MAEVSSTVSWVSQPNVCRFCLATSGTWDVTLTYITAAGENEVYSEMLQECFGIPLSYLAQCGRSKLVCESCVGLLRQTAAFRRRVLRAERQFLAYCGSVASNRPTKHSVSRIRKPCLVDVFFSGLKAKKDSISRKSAASTIDNTTDMFTIDTDVCDEEPNDSMPQTKHHAINEMASAINTDYNKNVEKSRTLSMIADNGAINDTTTIDDNNSRKSALKSNTTDLDITTSVTGDTESDVLEPKKSHLSMKTDKGSNAPSTIDTDDGFVDPKTIKKPKKAAKRSMKAHKDSLKPMRSSVVPYKGAMVPLKDFSIPLKDIMTPFKGAIKSTSTIDTCDDIDPKKVRKLFIKAVKLDDGVIVKKSCLTTENAINATKSKFLMECEEEMYTKNMKSPLSTIVLPKDISIIHSNDKGDIEQSKSMPFKNTTETISSKININSGDKVKSKKSVKNSMKSKMNKDLDINTKSSSKSVSVKPLFMVPQPIDKDNSMDFEKSKTKGSMAKSNIDFDIAIAEVVKTKAKCGVDNSIPIEDLSKTKSVSKRTEEIDKNSFISESTEPLKSFIFTRSQPIKQVSERKRVMITCETVLKHTSACPFRHHKSWFQCFFCTQDFMEINLLRTHTNISHSNIEEEIKKIKRYPRSLQIEISNLECRICQLSLTDVSAMRRHLGEVHQKVVYKECIADYKVDISPFNCHICGKQFHVFRSLTTHLNEHYANCICDVCGKSFLNSKRLKVHKRTHEKGNFPCSVCGKVLKTKTSKDNHMEVHFKRVIKCQICFKPMKHYNDRIKHMSAVHNMTHKFKCPFCSREYNVKHYLATHIRQTHGHKDKKCMECDMAFITNHGLKKHMLKHSGVKPYSCVICCKSYARSYTLREHMRCHSVEKVVLPE